jgi:hypothetical protein
MSMPGVAGHKKRQADGLQQSMAFQFNLELFNLKLSSPKLCDHSPAVVY